MKMFWYNKQGAKLYCYQNLGTVSISSVSCSFTVHNMEQKGLLGDYNLFFRRTSQICIHF